MKVKIVIKVPMHTEKDRSKAMQIAVAVEGVSSVSIGKENDELELIGDGVDSVCLANSLRKKFCFADILSVEEVKPPDSPDPSPPTSPPPPSPPWQPCQPCYYYYDGPLYDTASPNCSIM